MKKLHSTIAIILISSSILLAGNKEKIVKSELINGRYTPVVTLNTIDVSFAKKNVKQKRSLIAPKTFANSNSKLVRMIYINKKLVPLVYLKTADVTASRLHQAANDQSVNDAFTIDQPGFQNKILINGSADQINVKNNELISAKNHDKNRLLEIMKKVYMLLLKINYPYI